MDVKVGEFEGPFELLFHLIEKNKIDIKDIPIVLLTDQYIQYLKTFINRDMDSMSEFILMAATLLEIKSKMLLPIQDKNEANESIDPREELVQKLIEYKRAKLLAQMLNNQTEQYIFTKKPESSIINLFKDNSDVEIGEILENISLQHLYSVFDEVLLRKELKVDKVRSSFNSIKKDEFTIEGKIIHILNLLSLNGKIIFNNIFTPNSNVSEKVTTFIAMLELIKLKKIKISQPKNFDNIIIEVHK